MAEQKLTRLPLKNFIASASGMVNTEMFRHIYVRDQDGREFDATEDGVLSCAYVVSSLLTLYSLIDRPHATVRTTLDKMKEAGWQEVAEAQPGAVAYWPEYNGNEHIGVVISDNECVSNSSEIRTPIRHGMALSNGIAPTGFYIHPDLSDEK